MKTAGTSSLGSALLLAGCSKLQNDPIGPDPSGDSVLRIAHITDMHIMPDGPGPEGFARALRHLQALEPKVEVVFNTGDCVMDTLEVDEASAKTQWVTFKGVLQKECSLPVYHAIGNHDVWGWDYPDQSIASNPLYGKALAIRELDLSERYYSFDQAGWHFVVLDSTHQANPKSEYPYTGMLDDEQFKWLESELQNTPSETPVCILSHIPILCACEFFDGANEKTGNWVVPGAWMHIDARRMRTLFLQHPNVKLCLSGHAHQQEMLEYLGVKYLCDGAICGAWWQGPYLDFPPGYVVIDLYADGTSQSEFVVY